MTRVERMSASTGEALDDRGLDPVELYEHAPCGLLSMAPDGTLTMVNGTFATWTGHDPGTLVGRRLHELFAPGARIYYETHVLPMLVLQGMAREIAIDVVCSDGRRLPVVLNAVVDRDGGGEPHTIRAALFDASERRRYEQELLAARQAAEASERRARLLAETLQASLLPPEVLAVPGLDVAGAYRPSGDGSEVGGDFYDVFETGRGSWAVVLGDVCGKGAAAAAVTALARYTVRSEALRTPYPSAVLSSLHDAMCRYQPDRFCTAVLGVIDRQPTSLRLTLASGGHPLPILVRDGGLERIGVAGTLLGLVEVARLTDETVALEPGDVLVLYTDGVTEARRDGAFLDDAGLEAIIRDAGGLGARELAQEIVRATVAYQSGAPRDDIAVVVVRVPQPA